jgi:hypothetical protein
MEVLEEQGKLSRIRLGDNSEGWVETRYITQETPTRTILLELQAKYATLKRQVDSDIRAQQSEALPANPATPETELSERLIQAQKHIQQLEETIVEQKNQAEKMLRRQESGQPNDRKEQTIETVAGEPAAVTQQHRETSQSWSLPLSILGFLLSFIGGIAFRNYRTARRAGRSSL